jgi:hypothetical protein
MSIFTNKTEVPQLNSDDAFEDSDSLEWQGKPLYWSFRHWYFFLPMIKQSGEMCESEQITLALWVALHDEKGIKKLRTRWRNDRDSVFADFEEAPEKLGVEPGSSALAEAGEVVTHLIESVTASQETLAETDDDEEEDNGPGK